MRKAPDPALPKPLDRYMPGQAADELLNHLGPHMIVLADNASNAARIPTLIEEQGVKASIPAKSNRKWKPCFRETALPRAQPHRALLLQAEALPPRRHPL
ncbi:hypothetical protein DdX_21587 [Ditylenchus destructor]|uniref:Uncharacterized protein n=1 Tax=Ditylenchus destructor TaxID=166010 RepID=A0AAD4MEQ0_9BILA|nr:hypothetical protein DdX_21587 [Ditylenchus destructor]